MSTDRRKSHKNIINVVQAAGEGFADFKNLPEGFGPSGSDQHLEAMYVRKVKGIIRVERKVKAMSAITQ